MGMGSHSSSSYGNNYGCQSTQYAGQYGNGYTGAGADGCGGVAGNGYGAGATGNVTGTYGMGANGYSVGTGGLGVADQGLRGAQTVGANGLVAGGTYGVNEGIMLSANAPYGTAVSGGQYAGGQYANSQIAGVQTVQGAPIYVPQPYPEYCGVRRNLCTTSSAALPFGIEAGIGTELAIGGNIFSAKPAGPAMGSDTRGVSKSPAISYRDAYKNAVSYDLAATYDIAPSMTVIGRVGYAKAKGQRVQIGNVTDKTKMKGSEPYYATWSDLEEITLEGGVRKYMGGWNNSTSGIRPYVGATAGFTHNKAVSVVQDSAKIINPADPKINYIDAGWIPTAAGVIGAEMQVGSRTAIGVETGIRWRDNLNSIIPTDDRWSVPLKIRGRVSF